MKVTVSKQAIKIDGDPDAKGTHITVIDDIMRQISEQLGEKWVAGKLGGYWVIKVNDRGVFGGHAQPSGRKFSKVLANATQRAVVTSVEI